MPVIIIDAGASMMVMIGTAMMVLLDGAGRCCDDGDVE